MHTEKVKILLVDDDELFSIILRKFMEAKGFEVIKANSAKEGYDLFCKQQFDLCLLDVMMPVKDGFALAKELKTQNKNIPIIFITANSIKEQTLLGFDAGADDYINKPFEMEELFVRMQAILRRSLRSTDDADQYEKYNIGNYVFNYNTQTLSLGNEKRKLTTKEAQLLHLFVLNKNQLLMRSFALQTIWHENNHLNCRSMDIFITKLRRYLAQDENVKIVSLRSQGFKLLDKSETVETSQA